MTDRNAYIAFLEAQLERVSSACMEVQSYNDKIADVRFSTTVPSSCPDPDTDSISL